MTWGCRLLWLSAALCAGAATAKPPLARQATQPSVGFFADEWTEKRFSPPTSRAVPPAMRKGPVVVVDPKAVINQVLPTMFGQNGSMWMGPVADEPKFIEPMRDLSPHILRFPGGTKADVYFWNAQQDERPADAPVYPPRIEDRPHDRGYAYGRSDIDWQTSLAQYYKALEATGSRGLITVNYGYARYGTGPDPVVTAAKLAADWVRHDNGRTRYWEVGNENYGDWEWGYRIDRSKNQDGQPEVLSGALYAQHFKVFAREMRRAAAEVGAQIYIGAVVADLPADEGWESPTHVRWNAELKQHLGDAADFYVAHSYFTPFGEDSSSSTLLNAAQQRPARISAYLHRHFNRGRAQAKPVVLDEWNMWAEGSYQRVSHVSGLFAVIATAEMIKHRFGLSARWGLIDRWNDGDDHGLFSAGDEPDVPKWTPRPAFHHLLFFQKMLGDRLVSSTVKGNRRVLAYASTYSSGEVNLSLINTANAPTCVAVVLKGRQARRYYGYTLEGGDAPAGKFSRKVLVNGTAPSLPSGGPQDAPRIAAWSAPAMAGSCIPVPTRGAVYLVAQ